MAKIIKFHTTPKAHVSHKARKLGQGTLFRKALMAITILDFCPDETNEYIDYWHALNLLSDDEREALEIFYAE